jgi:2-phosphoglycerate kinase
MKLARPITKDGRKIKMVKSISSPMAKNLTAEQLLLINVKEIGEVVRKELAKVDFKDENSKNAFNAGILFTLFIILLIVLIRFA